MLERLPWDGPLPRHLAIIMDGNGRWAEQRGRTRLEGHGEGAEAVRTTVRLCRRLGIQALTLFAFSTENWKRPQLEIGGLMNLLYDYVRSERHEIMENGIRFNCIGRIQELPAFVQDAAKELMLRTRDNDGMVLTLALSYGGRDELVQVMKAIATRVQAGELKASDITDETVDHMLWMPADVDLLIRTSGEQRVSNFLLWQAAYAELFFTDTLWPDFSQEALFQALREFGRRERRYGSVNDSCC